MEKHITNLFKDKKILVSGGTGSIGSQIVLRLLEYNPAVVRVFSNDENDTFKLGQQIGEKDNIRFLIGDIRDKERLILAMEDIDIVYHASFSSKFKYYAVYSGLSVANPKSQIVLKRLVDLAMDRATGGMNFTNVPDCTIPDPLAEHADMAR